MTTGEKLTKLRKENNYTQEQLADILGVSRQSISKWETDIAYPETDKLIKIGELYGCSMDYLLKDGYDEISSKGKDAVNITIPLTTRHFEKKSKKTIRGVPLYHINIGIGKTAKGIIAIGFSSRGILSIGLFSIGIFSIGILPIGIISLGVLSLGLISAGAIAVGLIAAGSLVFGLLAIGAAAIGDFSIGALAVGKYFALGDHAYGKIAIGKTLADGIYTAKSLTEADAQKVSALLDETVPKILSLFKKIIMLLF